MKYFTTSFNPTGNHFIEECLVPTDSFGTVTRKMNVFTTPLSGASAVWAVGATSASSQFLLSYSDLLVERYYFSSGSNETFMLQDSPDRPLLAVLDSNSTLLPILSHPLQTSNYSAAAPLPDGGYLYVTQSQSLRQLRPNGADVTSLSLADLVPLVDAQITYSMTDKLWAIYTGATSDRYVHGALGDTEEASSLHLLYWDDTLDLIYSARKIQLEGDDFVFEGLAPMWADLDGDGIDDILTTVSGTDRGSALVGYLLEKDNDGGYAVKSHVMSEFIGTESSWLHQVAVGPLGPNGEREVVEIRTPHTSGMVRYYRLSQQGFDYIVGTEAYTSHTIGSRNLDMVTVGDFDGDGVPEVVVQDQSQGTLYGLQRTPCGVNVAWNATIPSRLQSNLAVSCNTDANSLHILFATQESLMRLEFSPTEESLEGLGAFAECLANSTSAAVVQTGDNILWMTAMCVLVSRWLIRTLI